LSTSRPTNTSRAYWELKAEQVMDRVFDNTTGRPAPTPLPTVRPAAEPAIEVEVRDASRPSWQIGAAQLPPQLAAGIAAGLGCLTLVGGISLWHGWSEARNDLRQERNLRLLEGIRSLETSAEPTSANQPTAGAEAEGLPPPPPNEPWIQELGQLESGGGGGGVAPLQVPLNGTLHTPAPPATAATGGSSAPASATPELLGVVQIPGKPGSAIFQVGGSSTNALVGENIGSSGWQLVSTTGDGAVIERGGSRRRVSISSGF
jgi:hypothetical protein